MLSKVIPPNLPLAKQEYDRSHNDQLTNVLRLHFNRTTDSLNALIGQQGGRHLNTPYAAAGNSASVTFGAANTAYQVFFDTAYFENGTTVNPADGISVDYSGVYNYQFSVQLRNSDSQAHSAWIWLRKNGVDIAATGSKFDVGAKHGAIDGYCIAACNFFVQLAGSDSVELWAAVDSTLVTFDAQAAQTVPFAMPSVPSIVATLSFVSEV